MRHRPRTTYGIWAANPIVGRSEAICRSTESVVIEYAYRRPSWPEEPAADFEAAVTCFGRSFNPPGHHRSRVTFEASRRGCPVGSGVFCRHNDSPRRLSFVLTRETTPWATSRFDLSHNQREPDDIRLWDNLPLDQAIMSFAGRIRGASPPWYKSICRGVPSCKVTDSQEAINIEISLFHLD